MEKTKSISERKPGRNAKLHLLRYRGTKMFSLGKAKNVCDMCAHGAY
jgi:hypothetical protein